MRKHEIKHSSANVHMDVLPWSWQQRRKLWTCGGLMAVAATIVAYKSYQSGDKGPRVSYLGRIRAALRKYSEAFLLGSDISSALLRDLQAFLASDAAELPQSFRQLLRLANSQVLLAILVHTFARLPTLCPCLMALLVIHAVVTLQLLLARKGMCARGIRAQSCKQQTCQCGTTLPEVHELLCVAAQEVQRSTEQLVSAAVRGARQSAAGSGEAGGGSGGWLESLLAALASNRGSSLLTLAISVACRFARAHKLLCVTSHATK